MRLPLRAYYNLLREYLLPQWPRALGLLALIVGGIGLQVWSPQLIRRFIDTAFAGDDVAQLPRLAALFIGAAVALQLMRAYTRYVSEYISWTATNHLRADLMLHCLRLDMTFHKAHTPGELVERVDGDVNQLAAFFSRLVVDLGSNALLMVGVVIILFREQRLAGGMTLLYAAVALALLLGVRNLAVPFLIKQREAAAEFYGFIGEQLSGREDLRANGGEGYAERRFKALLARLYQRTRAANLRSYSLWLSSIVATSLGDALAFLLGALFFRRGLMTLGAVYLIFSYIQLISQPLEMIRNHLQELQRASAGISRILELRTLRPTIVDGPGEVLPPGPLAVEFAGVSFGYGDDDLILRDISFTLTPGRVLGLLGRTGSGKTSLTRLLMRLYDPTTGSITLAGTAMNDLRLADLHRRVAVVTQDVQLFNASLRDNLTLFGAGIADARLVAVLDELELGEWYRGLSDGLDTPVAGNAGLSAGQAQLLACARVFLTDPGLVILDEASSRLDPATEALIERAIGRLLRGRTAIIIAHHLATIQQADEVMILDDGRIAEHGGRLALAADQASRFSQLLRTGLQEVLV